MNNEEKEVKQKDSATSERLQNISRRGFNTVTGGKWDKVRNAPVIGAAAKKAENKVADKLGQTKIGKKVANHQRPNLGAPTEDENEGLNTPSVNPNNSNNDVGSQNLKTSLGNRAKKLWNQRQKKKERDDTKEESDGSETEENSEDDSDTELSSKEKIAIKRAFRVKVAIIGALAFVFYFVIMAILSLITGGGIVTPASSYSRYGTDSFQAVTPIDSPFHKDEIAFYEKVKKYVEEGDGNVNMNYVVAILLEVFYEYDSSVEGVEESANLFESGGIDYAKMTNNLDVFVNFINDLGSSDYEIGGEIYNALMHSDEFKNYYKNILKNNDNTIENVLDNVFELAKLLDVSDVYDETAITSETNVNNSVNNKSKSMSINEYMADSIYASTNNLNDKEKVKAYTVIYSTNIVSANKKLTINSNYASTSNQLCSVKNGCSFDSSGNLVDGAGMQSDKNTEYYNGGYYYRVPLSSDEQKELTSTINSTFGNVLVNSDGTYPTLDVSKLDGFGEGDYKTIISNAYGDTLKYKNVGENSYILDGSYGDKKVKTDVIFYDQKDYPKNVFCGINGYTIGGSGCGVTAMAIVASTYENSRKYDPIYMNNEARKRGMCGRSGTSQAFFGKEATALHYKYSSGTKYNKNILNLALKHLSQGHLVVVRMGAGNFTGGGHYMVLGGVDPDTKKVYVYDPNNRSNSAYRKTGNGWYSFNDIIVKEAYNFYIIWKG